MELKVAHDPANALLDEEAETPDESKGQEVTPDSRGLLVDNRQQSMERGGSAHSLLWISVGTVRDTGSVSPRGSEK